MTTPINQTDANDQVVWGARKIAPHLGRSEKGAFHALESGKVPGARKIAGRWALDIRVFRASFKAIAA
jgi:hypothetical protein